jgi:hypothetical protein
MNKEDRFVIGIGILAVSFFGFVLGFNVSQDLQTCPHQLTSQEWEDMFLQNSRLVDLNASCGMNITVSFGDKGNVTFVMKGIFVEEGDSK